MIRSVVLNPPPSMQHADHDVVATDALHSPRMGRRAVAAGGARPRSGRAQPVVADASNKTRPGWGGGSAPVIARHTSTFRRPIRGSNVDGQPTNHGFRPDEHRDSTRGYNPGPLRGPPDAEHVAAVAPSVRV